MAVTVAVVGATVRETGAMVTVEVPVLLESAALVAVTITVEDAGTVAGAV